MKQKVFLNNGEIIEVDTLPCPFCSSQPKICHIGNTGSNSQKIEFKCPDCRIKRVNAVRIHSIKWCLESSLSQWNERS